MTGGRRAAVLVAYLAVFWVALPAVLWTLARAVDRAQRWTLAPRPVPGALLLVAGIGLLGWALGQLRGQGGGLPIGALPPPRLADRGPYAALRHPIYLGFNVALAGAGFLLGSTGLAAVIAPAFLPCWVGYALVEERGLLRRFGDAYRSYRRRVGMLPRFAIYGVGFLLLLTRIAPVQVVGRRRIPRRGAAVLVCNHASYADFLFVGAAAIPRRLCYMATAEAWRWPLQRLLLGRALTVPVRRYRTDPLACREMLRMLAAGHLVCVAVEGERSTLGRRLPVLLESARVLARLPCPVIPVGVSGSYDAGPRWAGVLRRRHVTVRVGAPVAFLGRDPARAIDEALRWLVDEDPQRVRLRGVAPSAFARILWRCPACLDEAGWDPPSLACRACGARWTPTGDGRFRGPRGAEQTLAAVAEPVWAAPERAPLRIEADAGREASMYGPVRPLEALGRSELAIDPEALRFEDLAISVAAIRTVTTERNDTLQVSTAGGMWQFRVRSGSVFRLQNALERWRIAGRERVAR